ncbi:hypothetical protein [Streptomyces sp. NRRL WC-3742]|uniref:hypothetical protein n=1 Tax=Streptomyces sp. NRRL WC-3742 TaxID=1463934 RepID=UPI0004C8E610|nr:hypothetical protein [Streptomyces sp. NRRL WC-3742]
MDELKPPTEGMTISVWSRQDVVVVDPERFMAAARAAFRQLYPDVPEEAVADHLADVHDAAFALLDLHGRLTPDPPGTTAGLPGRRLTDRADGLSPAGDRVEIVLNLPRPLQDYGCFGPEDAFARPTDPPS